MEKILPGVLVPIPTLLLKIAVPDIVCPPERVSPPETVIPSESVNDSASIEVKPVTTPATVIRHVSESTDTSEVSEPNVTLPDALKLPPVPNDCENSPNAAVTPEPCWGGSLRVGPGTPDVKNTTGFCETGGILFSIPTIAWSIKIFVSARMLAFIVAKSCAEICPIPARDSTKDNLPRIFLIIEESSIS